MSETIFTEDPEPSPAAEVDLLEGLKQPGSNWLLKEDEPRLIERVSQHIGHVARVLTSDYFYEKTEDNGKGEEKSWIHEKADGEVVTGELRGTFHTIKAYTEDLLDEEFNLLVVELMGESRILIPVNDADKIVVSK